MNDTAIVICHHFGSLINICLNSLQHLSCKIVVMTSDLEFWKKNQDYPNVEIIYTINNPCWKRNIAVKKLPQEIKYVAFLDDDVKVERNTISCLRQMLNNFNEVGMVYATLYKPDGTIDNIGVNLSWTGFLIEPTSKPLFNKEVLAGKSACCMVKRDVFEDVGGFDTDFVIYCEETDLSWRMWLRGYEVWLEKNAIATHYSETKFKTKDYYDYRLIHYHGCKNYLTMLIKNLGWYNLLPLVVNVAVWGIMGVFFMFKSPKKAKYIFLGIGYNVINLVYILSKRHPIQKGRVKTDLELYPYIYKTTNLRYYFTRFWQYLSQ